MDTPQVKFNVSIKTLQRRDKLRSLLLTAKEHERIAESRFHLYKSHYADKEKSYLEWCQTHHVDSFM